MGRYRGALAVVAAYAAATVVFTWPLAAHLGTRLPAAAHQSTWNDTLLLAWVLSWDVHQLVRDPVHLFEANIFHPLRHTLGYSEAMISEALLLLPLAPLTPNPVLLYNVTLLLSFLIGAIGTFLLVRHLSGNLPAAALAGLLFAFAPYRFWQIDRMNALAFHWTPLLMLALHQVFEGRGGRRVALLAVAFALQALASIYVAFATVIFVGLFLVARTLSLAAGTLSGLGRALGALALGGAVVGLAYAPYVVVRDEMGLARDPGQLVVHSVVPAEIGRAVVTAPAYLIGKLTEGRRGGGTLGLTAALLALAGAVVGGRAARLYAAMALGALVLSFGPLVFVPGAGDWWLPGPYRLLHDHVPGFAAMREPRRLTGFVVAFGAIAAGLGAAAILARARSPGRRRTIALGLGALVILEIGWQPLALRPSPEIAPRRELYRHIARAPGTGAVVELPIGSPDDEAVATFRSTYHLRPLVNGASGFQPTTAPVRRRLARFPNRDTVRWLRRLGVRFVVYDTQRRGARSASALDRRLGRAVPGARVTSWGAGVVLAELAPLPPSSSRPPGVTLPRDEWSVRSSAGDAAAVLDGDPATHWTASVHVDSGGGWLEVDFGREADLSGLRLQLGPHFGEYPRAWRVLTLDGRLLAVERYAEPPLMAYRVDHRRLAMDLPLPPTRARGLRLEVPPLRLVGRRPPFDVPAFYWGWSRWGVHELIVYRR